MTSLRDDLGAYLKEQRRTAELSLRQLAEAAGISNPYLSQIERGLRKPSAEILQSLAKGLRISAESLYVRAGILEDRPEHQRALTGAILADPGLTERQKNVLLDIYRAFVAENDRVTGSDRNVQTTSRSHDRADVATTRSAPEGEPHDPPRPSPGDDRPDSGVRRGRRRRSSSAEGPPSQ
ncbi:MAG: helix-turn-helix domain-containing protein [Angustibacter sp.]